jgi:hypothetical protein
MIKEFEGREFETRDGKWTADITCNITAAHKEYSAALRRGLIEALNVRVVSMFTAA